MCTILHSRSSWFVTQALLTNLAKDTRNKAWRALHGVIASRHIGLYVSANAEGAVTVLGPLRHQLVVLEAPRRAMRPSLAVARHQRR